MPKKLTCAEILKRVQVKSPEVIGIVESSFINPNSFAIFIDKDYGEFKRYPAHMMGIGSAHPKRVAQNKCKKSSLSVEEIEKRLKEVHGDEVTIDKDSYISSHKKATFIDKKYGSWSTVPSIVVRGHGHPHRSLDNWKIAIEEIKQRIFKAHGNTVSILEETYKGTTQQAIFIDKDYGQWQTEVKSVLKGRGHPKRGTDENRVSLEVIKKRLISIYDEQIEIIDNTYVDTTKKSKFIDKKYGEFTAQVGAVLQKQTGHPQRRIDNNIEKFGFANPILNKEIRLKAIKAANAHYERIHWKTGEILDCQASWEPRVIDYLNANKKDFLWQPKSFTMPNGRQYNPDLFLIDENKWIEIKGYMRPDSQLKWDWFKTIYPTAELWDEKKLKELGIL